MKFSACVLIEKDGLVLAVSRKNNHAAFGLPGGKCDPGETIEHAAIRELEEETGLVLTDPIPIFTRYPDFNDDYCCTTFIGNISGEIKTSEEGVVKFVTWKTLFEGPFSDYNLKLHQSLYK